MAGATGGETLEWLGRQAAADGIPRIYLDSRATAKGFYERLGYTLLDVDSLLEGDFFVRLNREDRHDHCRRRSRRTFSLQ